MTNEIFNVLINCLDEDKRGENLVNNLFYEIYDIRISRKDLRLEIYDDYPVNFLKAFS